MSMRRDNPGVNDRPINIDNVHTILGPESRFEGKLSFEGTVRVDGQFKGEIVTSDVLVVGQGARIDAQLKVGSIIVNGEVHGDLIAQHSVELHAPAKLYGNITTPQITIDKGVIFEGSCKMDGQGRQPALAAAPRTEPDKKA